MGMLGLAGTGEAGFVAKATMELKPCLPAQSASTSSAKVRVKHTPHVNNRNIIAGHESVGESKCVVCVELVVGGGVVPLYTSLFLRPYSSPGHSEDFFLSLFFACPFLVNY